MPLIDSFLNLNGYARPIEPIVAAPAKLDTFLVPDPHWSPDVWVYFDFVRAVTADPETLVQSGAMPDLSTTYGSVQAQKRVDYYYKLFASYRRIFGIEMRIPEFSPSPSEPGSLDEKQDALNLIIRHFISGVSVQRTSTGPGTATITISFPTYDSRYSGKPSPSQTRDDLLFWNHFFTTDTASFTVLDQLITPHTWVYIYGRGRTDPKNYYPIFTGFTNRVTLTNQGGYTGLQVVCEDTQKLLHKSQIRLNPAIGDVTGEKLKSVIGENFTFFSNPLSGLTLQEIANTLILGDKNDQFSAGGVFDYAPLFTESQPDVASFQNYAKYRTIPYQPMENIPSAIRTLRRAAPNVMIMWGVDITPYRALFPMRSPSFMTSEFMNRMEALREVARRSMVEFYSDATGSYQIHPYRFSTAFLASIGIVSGTLIPDPAPSAFVLPKEEIKTSTFSLSDEELITALAFQGETPLLGDALAKVDFFNRRAPAISQDLVGRFGVWYAEHKEPLVNVGNDEADSTNDGQSLAPLLQLFAFARLAYNNRDTYSGQVVIPFRAEMEVARPVYFPDQRDLGYIVNMEHNIQIGGDSTTSLSLTFARKVDALPIDFTDFLVQSNTSLEVGTLSADEQRVLLSLFEAASGFNRLDPNITFGIGSPGSVQVSPTTQKFIEMALAAKPENERDKGLLLSDIISTFGKQRFLGAAQ